MPLNHIHKVTYHNHLTLSKLSMWPITEFFSMPTTSSDISSDPDSGPPLQTKKGKHRESGFDPAWLNEFPWLLYENDEKNGPSMFCSLCCKYNQVTKKMSWIEIPCKLFRRDKVREHQLSGS